MVGDVNISDVLGLGKMVEVVGKGIGTIYQPFHLKRLSKVRQEQIETSTGAAIQHGNLKAIEYSADALSLVYQESSLEKPVSQELLSAAQTRFIEREVRRQVNIESTIEKAANSFGEQEKVTNEDLSQEWIDRYFDSIQDVSDEDLQSLWAKVLAGEIKKPTSFSLRTLDILKNMTTEEAEVFARLAKISIDMGNSRLILNDTELLRNHYDVTYADILLLDDIGLINSENSLRYNISPRPKNSKTPMVIGNSVLIITSLEDTPKLNINSFPLTRSGRDLCSLVDDESADYHQPLFEAIAKMLSRHKNIKLTVADAKVTDKGVAYNLDREHEI